MQLASETRKNPEEAKEMHHHHHHHFHHHNEMQVATRSEVQKFYTNRSALITGGSGFIGKVLIEKLLRSCPELRRLFVLIRPKHNKQPEERLNEFLDMPLFEQVRRDGRVEGRLVVVEGDISLPNLGLSEQNLLRVMNEVSVIFHSAATVKFDDPLKQSVAINILGTKHIIELCRKIPNLAALVHVSTAYANCDRSSIEEHIYPVKLDPDRLIQMAEWLDQDTLQELKVRLLEGKPNTYTYTKSLAEWLLIKGARDLPVVVCRPSIVTASWREPFAGWIDNYNGPTGIILGVGKGFIRTAHASTGFVGDLIPVDSVINMVITLGWFANVYHKHKRSHQQVGAFVSNSSDSSNTDSISASSSPVGSRPLSACGDEIDLEQLELSAIDEVSLEDDSSSLNQQHHHHHHLHHLHRDIGNIIINNNNNDYNDGMEMDGVDRVSASTKIHDEPHVETSKETFKPAANNHQQGKLAPTALLQQQQQPDDGYASTHSQSPDVGSRASSSSCLLVNNNNAKSALSETANSAQPAYHDSVSINKSAGKLLTNDSGKPHQVMSLVSAQRRLLEQQQRAVIDYKLKQFRHSKLLYLTKNNLPEELADIPVFHCTSGAQNPIKWYKTAMIIISALVAYPCLDTIRVPGGSFTDYRSLHNFYSWVLHYLPAYILDFFASRFSDKPKKVSAVRIYRKFDQAMEVFEPFALHQWHFSPTNHRTLLDEFMSYEDKLLFNCDIQELDWNEYLTNYVLGVRKYLLKEPMSNLEQARKNLRKTYIRNTAIQVFVGLLLVCLATFISFK